jgi:predicted nuclease of predicted toxin-antitoxin system
VRLKIDENLPPAAAALFRSAGHDATTVGDEDLGGALDVTLAAAARAEDRALVTLDTGFADIRAYPPESYPGLMVLRLSRQDATHVLRVIERLTAVLLHEDPNRRLWIVEEERVRIRS